MAGFGDIFVETLSGFQAAKFNEAQAKAEAKLIETEAQTTERSSREQSKRVQAEARAQIGASGAGIEGSPLEILIENAKQSELEALNIRYSGQARAAAKKQEAKFLKSTKKFIIAGGIAKGIGRAASMASAGAGAGGGGGLGGSTGGPAKGAGMTTGALQIK